MPLSKMYIRRIFEKNKEHLIELEHYDSTREKLWAKKRIDITLPLRTIKMLKIKSAKTGRPVSHIIAEALAKQLG